MSLLMDALRRAEEARRTHAKDDDKTPQRAPERGPELSLAPADGPTRPADASHRGPEAGAQTPASGELREEEQPPAPAGDGAARGGTTLSLSPMQPEAPRPAPDAASEAPDASGTQTWSSADLRPHVGASGGGLRPSSARPSRHAPRAMLGPRAVRRRARMPVVGGVLVLTLVVLGAGGYRYWQTVSSGPSVTVRSSPTTHAVGSVQPRDLQPTGSRVTPGPRATSSAPRAEDSATRREPAPRTEADTLAASGAARDEIDVPGGGRAPSFGSFGPDSAQSPSGAPQAAGEAYPAPRADGGAAAERRSGESELAAAAPGRAGSEIRITRAPRTDPVQAQLARAYQAFRDANYPLAEVRYQAVLEQEAGNRDALLGLAAVAVGRGDLNQAARRYLQVLKRNPRDSVAQAGLIGLQEGADPVASESRLKLLLEEEPSAAHLHFSLGNLYAEQGRWAEAERAYFEAYRADSGNPDYALNLAVSLDHMRQSTAALSYYRRALELASHGRGGFEPEAVRDRIRALSESMEGS